MAKDDRSEKSWREIIGGTVIAFIGAGGLVFSTVLPKHAAPGCDMAKELVIDDTPNVLLDKPLRDRIGQTATEKVIRCMKEE